MHRQQILAPGRGYTYIQKHSRSEGETVHWTRHTIRRILTVLLAILPVAAWSSDKQPIGGADDLPRHTYDIPGSVTDLLGSESDFGAFLDSYESDLRSDLATYEISDRTVLRRIHGSLMNIAMLRADYRGALEYIPQLRELSNKEAERLLTGLFNEAVVAAGIEEGLERPSFREVFREEYFQRISNLPWPVIEEEIRGSKGREQYFTENVLRHTIRSEFDPAVEKAGHISRDLARRIVIYQLLLTMKIPLSEDSIAVYRRAIDELSEPLVNIWQGRDVKLDPAAQYAPVPVAVWDTGIDTDLFIDRLLASEGEVLDGTDTDGNGYIDDLYGIAFGANRGPVAGDLLPLDTLSSDVGQVFPLYQGYADFFVGRDSAEADRVIALLGTMSPEEMDVFYADMGLLGQYVHGTHIAGIVAEGNPFVRLLSIRQTFPASVIPELPTFATEHREAAILHAVIDYLKQRQVRVVNMSWIGLRSWMESALEAHGVGDTAEERAELARRLFEVSRDAAFEAFRRAPEILFIGAAGNQNQDIDFAEIYPSSFELPNLLIVGAVNQAGQATDFTSMGSTVGVYANGYDVESLVPGGQPFKASGTSQATPQVTNLAAKILAVAPHLAPAEVIQIIKDGSDEAAGELPLALINPKRSIELARQRSSGGSGAVCLAQGEYFGETVPEEQPGIFAPGIASTHHHDDWIPVFSPDGREVILRILGKMTDEILGVLFWSRVDGSGCWSVPAPLPFSGRYMDGAVVYAVDGLRIYFTSKRPGAGEVDPGENSRIWFVDRVGESWGSPVLLDSPVNEFNVNGGLSMAADGTLFVAMETPSGKGMLDIYELPVTADGYSQVKPIRGPVNTEGQEVGPFIDSQKRFLIYTRYSPDTGLEALISRPLADGRWGSPQPLAAINEYDAKFAGLSPDGEILFFVSHRQAEGSNPEARWELDFFDDLAMEENADLYWVSSNVVEEILENTASDGSYLGLERPGKEPELFAPGIVSTGLHEHSCPSFSPDGREVLWTSYFADNYAFRFPSLISMMQYSEGQWGESEFADFSNIPDSGEAAFSPDGNMVFFSAPGRPVGDEERGKLDIWKVERTAEGWGNPENLGSPINTPNHEGQVSVTAKGTLYYKGYWEGGKNNYGIYRSRMVEGRYSEPELLPDVVNSTDLDWTPFVSPDESYLLFSSLRSGGFGSGDIYVSFRSADDSWTPAINLGSNINGKGNERYPCVSPDGRYLFFVSDRIAPGLHESDDLTREDFLRAYTQPGNGWSDVYWIDATFLDSIAAEALDPAQGQ
jgi:subtilisin family serine protease